MRIRKYNGKDMQEALGKVRSDLGSEAVILNTRKVKRHGIMAWFSKPHFEVLAAIDENYQPLSRIRKEGLQVEQAMSRPGVDRRASERNNATDQQQSSYRENATVVQQPLNRGNPAELQRSPYRDDSSEPHRSPYRDDSSEPQRSPYRDNSSEPQRSPYRDNSSEPHRSPYRDDSSEPQKSPYRDDSSEPRRSPNRNNQPNPQQVFPHDITDSSQQEGNLTKTPNPQDGLVPGKEVHHTQGGTDIDQLKDQMKDQVASMSVLLERLQKASVQPLQNRQASVVPVVEPDVDMSREQHLPNNIMLEATKPREDAFEVLSQQKTTGSVDKDGRGMAKAVRAVALSDTLPLKTREEAATANDVFTQLQKQLLMLDIEENVAERIIGKVQQLLPKGGKPEEVKKQTERVLAAALGEPAVIQLKPDGKPVVAVLLGPTGVGKTTTLAKIAADFALNKHKKVGLITADTYRIAAVEQLKTYAEILNLPVIVVYTTEDMHDAIASYADKDIILVDTAGRSHHQKAQFDELRQTLMSLHADEVFLVLSGSTGKVAAREVLDHYTFMKDYKLLFTKLDEIPVPGVIFNMRLRSGKPISYITVGQSVPDDFAVADPKALAAGFMQQVIIHE